jgi:hypothetical protein
MECMNFIAMKVTTEEPKIFANTVQRLEELSSGGETIRGLAGRADSEYMNTWTPISVQIIASNYH